MLVVLLVSLFLFLVTPMVSHESLREPRGGPENLGRRRVPSTRFFRLSMVVFEDRRTATGDLPPETTPGLFRFDVLEVQSKAAKTTVYPNVPTFFLKV